MSFRLFARLAGASIFLLALTGVAAKPVSAQGVDLIVGSVKDSAGRPIKGASVEAYSIETRISNTRPTDDKGNYTIIINDGGGMYRLTVRAIGMTPQIRLVSIQGDDDRIIQHFKLGAQAVPLADINTNANNGGRGNDPSGGLGLAAAGDQSRELSAADAARLGLSLIDGIAALAGLAPGVIMVPGSDSSALGFQVNGQSIQDNSILIDGLAAAGLIPQDGMGRTRVITNTFDASRGGFTGGQVTTTTARGNNFLTGSLSLSLQDRHLAWGEGAQTVNASGLTQQVLGAGVGGPIIRGKLTAYGSFSATRGVQPVPSLNTVDSIALARMGLSADSATRFKSIVNNLGLAQHVGTISDIRGNDQGVFSIRSDFNHSGGSLSWTANLNLRGTDPTLIQNSQLPMVGGTQGSDGWGTQITTVNRYKNVFTNTLRAKIDIGNNDQDGFIAVPTGTVQNYSEDVADHPGKSFNTMGFGGNGSSPQRNHTVTYNIDNQLSYITPGGAHRFLTGLTFNATSNRNDNTSNRYGSYTYESLVDFENNHPSRFTRTLQPQITEFGKRDLAMFINDNYRRGNLQVTLGTRFEKTFYQGAPKLNQEAFDLFGVRTDKLPSEFAVLPTVGFQYAVPAGDQQGNAQRGFGGSSLTINGGIRLARSGSNGNLPQDAQRNAGFSTNETKLDCTGDQVPVPDWASYAADPSTIPTVCADGSSPNPITTGRKTVTTYEPGFGPNRTIRMTLGARKRITPQSNLNFTFDHTRGYNISATRDLNLKLSSPFLLANEANRPVFVDPSKIITTNGQIPSNETRINDDYGTVREYFNTLKSTNTALGATFSGTTRLGMQFSLSTTLSWGRDQGGSNGATAASPNSYEWGRSSNERRVNIQGSVSWPLPFTKGALELVMRGGLQSGSHYSPLVSGDVNGDGSRSNDLAFVFDPSNTADTAVSAAMDRVLGSLKGDAKKCLESQIGKIATRNSCTGPWTPSFSLNANWRPGFFGHRLVISFNTSNFLQGLDNLVHGGDEMHGWGNPGRPSSTLLRINGFDPATKTYKYTVNELYGQTNIQSNPIRQPFQLAINMRYSLGFDQTVNRINQASGGSPGTFGPEFIKNVQLMFPNLAKAVLVRKDSIQMSPDQVATISKLANEADSVLTVIVKQLEIDQRASGGTLDPLKLAPLFVTLTTQQDAIKLAVEATLSDVQWALLPESVRNMKTGAAAIPQPGQNNNNNGGRGGPGGGGQAGGGGRGGGGQH